MYEHFYRFKEKPFSLTPDPKFLYLSKQHQGALDHMLYGIKQREGFMAIVGDVGTGKTTLCRCLLERLEPNVEVALILNPLLSDMDLLRACVHDLRAQPSYSPHENPVMAGASPASGLADEGDLDPRWIHKASKKELLDALNAFLLRQHETGGSTVLIIDEAQNLSLEVLEQLRILSNLETEKEKLLQIIFVGQLELNGKLKLPELKQLNQRISIRYEITPLSREETKNYISHRILVAGAVSRIAFTRAALNEIYSYSRGYPRLINLVCDRALLAGCNDKADTIGVPQVKRAIRSLLGAEDKSYFVEQFLKPRLSLFASILFFIAGLLFFLFSENGFFRAGKEIGGGRPPAQPVREAAVDPAPRPAAPPSEPAPAPEKPAPKAEAVSEPAALEEPPAQAAAPQEKTPPAAVAAPEEKKDVQPKNIEPPAAPKQEKESYRIQIDSMNARAQAEDAIRQLQKEGFNAYWKKVDSSGRSWYTIYVGPFEDLNSAKIHYNALKQTGRNPMLFSVSKSD